MLWNMCEIAALNMWFCVVCCGFCLVVSLWVCGFIENYCGFVSLSCGVYVGLCEFVWDFVELFFCLNLVGDCLVIARIFCVFCGFGFW